MDMGGVVVEEAVGEASGGTSEVGAGESGWVEVELGECVVEFEAASGDICVRIGGGVGVCFGWLGREIHDDWYYWISVVEVVVMGAWVTGTPTIAILSWSARSIISMRSSMMTSPAAIARHEQPCLARFSMV